MSNRESLCACGHPFAPNHQTPGAECSVYGCNCTTFKAKSSLVADRYNRIQILRQALRYATPQPPWLSAHEVVEHADDGGVDLHGANALLAKSAVNALPALLGIAEAAAEYVAHEVGDDPTTTEGLGAALYDLARALEELA